MNFTESCGQPKISVAKNGYPSRIVEKSMNKAVDSLEINRSPHVDCAGGKHFDRRPWIGQKSPEFGHEFQDKVRKSYPTTTHAPPVVFTTTRAFLGRAEDILP